MILERAKTGVKRDKIRVMWNYRFPSMMYYKALFTRGAVQKMRKLLIAVLLYKGKSHMSIYDRHHRAGKICRSDVTGSSVVALVWKGPDTVTCIS